jgi:serine/threonine protein kinase
MPRTVSPPSRTPRTPRTPRPIDDADMQWDDPQEALACKRAVQDFTQMPSMTDKVEWLCQTAAHVASTIAQERRTANQRQPSGERLSPTEPSPQQQQQPQGMTSVCLTMWCHARLFECIVLSLSTADSFAEALVAAAADVVGAFRSVDAVCYAVSLCLEQLAMARGFSGLASVIYYCAACLDDLNNLYLRGGEHEVRATEDEMIRLELLEDVIEVFAEVASAKLPYRDEALKATREAVTPADMMNTNSNSGGGANGAAAAGGPGNTPNRRDLLVASVPRLDLGGVSPIPARKGKSGGGGGNGGAGTSTGLARRTSSPGLQPFPMRSVDVSGASKVTNSAVGRIMTFRLPDTDTFVGQSEELQRRRFIEALLSTGHKAGQLYVTSHLSTLLGMKTEYEARRGGALVTLSEIEAQCREDFLRTHGAAVTSDDGAATAHADPPRAYAHQFPGTFPMHASTITHSSEVNTHVSTIYESRDRRVTLLGETGIHDSALPVLSNRPLLSALVIEVVTSVATHQNAGWSAPYDSVLLLLRMLDSLCRLFVTEHPHEVRRSPAMCRAEEFAIAASMLPPIRADKLDGAQLDTPTVCIAEIAITCSSTIACVNDAAHYKSCGTPCTGTTFKGFAKDSLPFPPVIYAERVALHLNRLVRPHHGATSGGGGTKAAKPVKKALPLGQCTWYLATLNGFLGYFAGTSSVVVPETARVVLPSVAAIIDHMGNNATFTYTPTDPYAALLHQLLELIDAILTHANLPPVVLEATLHVALGDTFSRIVQASLHNMFTASEGNWRAAMLEDARVSAGIDSNIVSRASPSMSPAAAEPLRSGQGSSTPTPGLHGIKHDDALAILTPSGGTFLWPDCPSMRKMARRLVLHAECIARFERPHRGVGSAREEGDYTASANDLVVGFCDPYTGPALQTLALPVGATPFKQAVVLSLLQSQLGGHKRAGAFLASPRSPWAASFVRFLYLTFLQTFHSSGFAPNAEGLDALSTIAAAAVKTLRLLLMWGTPESRTAARRLGIVATLAREFDLEHNIDERRAQELRRTTTAMIKYTTSSPKMTATAADNSRLDVSDFRADLSTTTQPDSGVANTVEVFARSLRPRRSSLDDEASSEDDDDAFKSSGTIPAAAASTNTPLVPTLSMRSSIQKLEPRSLPATEGDAPSAPVAPATPVAPKRVMPKIPKLSLTGASLPLYFTSKAGDTGGAAEAAIFGKPPTPPVAAVTSPVAVPTKMMMPKSIVMLPKTASSPNVQPAESSPSPPAPPFASPGYVHELPSEDQPSKPKNVWSESQGASPHAVQFAADVPSANASASGTAACMLVGGSSVDQQRRGQTPLTLLRRSTRDATVFLFDAPASASVKERPADPLAHSGSINARQLSSAREAETKSPDEVLSPTVRSVMSDVALAAINPTDMLNHTLFPERLLEDSTFLDHHRRFRRVYVSQDVHVEMVLCVLAGLLAPRGYVDPDFADSYTMTNRKVNLFYFVEAHIRHERNNFLPAQLRHRAAASAHAGLELLVMLISPSPEFGERYVVGDEIGSGAYGLIHECDISVPPHSSSMAATNTHDAAPSHPPGGGLVIKRTPVAQHALDRVAVVRAHAEALALMNLSGVAGVCSLVDVGNTGQHYCLVMPRYFSNITTWCGAVRVTAQSAVAKARLYLRRFTEILVAVASVHEHGIVHGDIKAENIFIDYADNVAIGDFGDCEFVSKEDKVATLLPTMLGTEAIRSPELVVPHQYADRRKRQSTAFHFLRDVWALGCLLYEMATGVMLFATDDTGEMIHRITNADADVMTPACKKQLRDAFACANDADAAAATAAIESLIVFTLQRDPTLRPALAEVLARVATTRDALERQSPLLTSQLPSFAAKEAVGARPASLGRTLAGASVSFVHFASTINWDIARTDSLAMPPFELTSRRQQSGLGFVRSSPPQSPVPGAPGSLRHAVLPQNPATAAQDFVHTSSRVRRRWFGVASAGVLITACAGQPPLQALSTVRATHLVNFVSPHPLIASSLNVFSLEDAVVALIPMLSRRCAAEVNGYTAPSAPESPRAGGADSPAKEYTDEEREADFADSILEAVGFIQDARVTKGVVVITSFVVRGVDLAVVIALVFAAKTYGVAPRYSLPTIFQGLVAARDTSEREISEYGLTVALAERCLSYLPISDYAPTSPTHIFNVRGDDASPTGQTSARGGAPTRPPAAAAPAPRRYQCLCGVHAWRLPKQALTANVVVDSAAMRLAPADVLPRMQMFAFMANLNALFEPEFVGKLLEGDVLHVATVPAHAATPELLRDIVPSGDDTAMRPLDSDDGRLLVCEECNMPIMFLPATRSEHAKTFGVVLLCLLPVEGRTVECRVDRRRLSWMHHFPTAQATTASFDIR